MSKYEVIIAIIQTVVLLTFSFTAFLIMRRAFKMQDQWNEKLRKEKERDASTQGR